MDCEKNFTKLSQSAKTLIFKGILRQGRARDKLLLQVHINGYTGFAVFAAFDKIKLQAAERRLLVYIKNKINYKPLKENLSCYKKT